MRPDGQQEANSYVKGLDSGEMGFNLNPEQHPKGVHLALAMYLSSELKLKPPRTSGCDACSRLGSNRKRVLTSKLLCCTVVAEHNLWSGPERCCVLGSISQAIVC
eukprot:758960-Amphidinium_carterae.1